MKFILHTHARTLLALTILAYVVLTLIYTLNTPPMEAPDAYYHYGVIEYISREAALPPRENPEDHPWTHAVFHAPLYYAMSGLLIAPLDTSDFPGEYPHNPHARIGLPHSLNNHNFVSIKGEAWQDTYLAVYIIRAFSIVCGAVTLVAIFMLARLMAPGRPSFALLATLLVALNPQFLYISSVINNDNLVVALSILTLVMLVYMIKIEYSWRWVIGISFILAINSLVKVNSLPLYPTVGLGLTWIAYRDRLPFATLVKWAVVMTVIWAVLAGWWYVDNQINYGDLTATVPLAEAAGGGSGVPTGIDALWDEFVGVYYSFWGLFGWFNIIAPPVFYSFVTGLLAISGAGLVIAFVRQPTDRDTKIIIALLVIHAALVFAGWWRFRGMVSAAQGRMLFSVLGALALGTAYGLIMWRDIPFMRTSLVAGMGAAAIAFPITLLAPAYELPAQLDEIPEDVNLVDVRYGPVVLRGYKIDSTPVDYWDYEIPEDREFVEITLYWQPLEQTDIPLSMFVQVFAPDENYEPVEVGKVDSYPGRGMMRTDAWDTDIIYADTYYLELYGDFDLTPFEPRFRVGLRDNETNTEIPATTMDGEPIQAVVPRGGSVYSSEIACDGLDNLAQFGNLARLTGYDAQSTEMDGDTLIVAPNEAFDLTLLWDVIGESNEFFAVYVQLIDPDDPATLLGSGDSAPLGDWYPTTRWVDGVCFDDFYTVTVDPDTPPGEYQLIVGLYRPQEGTRLPVYVEPDYSFADGYLIHIPIIVKNPS